MQNYEG
jgi:hypothetical protein